MWGTITHKAGEYDLVLTKDRETDPWVASIYRSGKTIPIRRTTRKNETAAVMWFDRFLTEIETK